MITENIQALVAYRLEQADESLDAARVEILAVVHGGRDLDRDEIKPWEVG